MYIYIYLYIARQRHIARTPQQINNTLIREDAAISSCFFGRDPGTLKSDIVSKKTSTINMFGLETLKLKLRGSKLWKPTVSGRMPRGRVHHNKSTTHLSGSYSITCKTCITTIIGIINVIVIVIIIMSSSSSSSSSSTYPGGCRGLCTKRFILHVRIINKIYLSVSCPIISKSNHVQQLN